MKQTSFSTNLNMEDSCLKHVSTKTSANWMKPFALLIGILFIGFSFAFAQGGKTPIKVETKLINGKWVLLRDGKPYYVKGAGGTIYPERIKAYGGNSIRTWNYDNAESELEMAEKNGLTVTLGLWFGCERHGFDYNDEVGVAKQLNQFKKVVDKFKNYPALLMWGLGNEMDLFYTNPKVYDAVNDLVKYIHEVDPNHPCLTVTAGFHQDVMNEIIKRAPDLDVYGVNTYGGLEEIPGIMAKSGWKKPYIVTEWGPSGHWEVQTTSWKAPIEETSSQKGAIYLRRYQKGILADSNNCIGSYCFVWGHKQETTSTWYGMFSDKGEESAAVDAVQFGWSGKWPENTAPRLDSIQIDGKCVRSSVYLNPGQKYNAIAFSSDRENDKLTFQWEVVSESTDKKAGGDAEARPPAVPGCIKSQTNNTIVLRAPIEAGQFRLFVYVYDGKNKYGYGNFPFCVNAPDPKGPQIQPIKQKAVDMDSFKDE